jgi:glucosyl-3-phosphoglycerate synthase
VLPCLYSELAQPALANIVSELRKASYISEIVIGLDRATEQEFQHALDYFSVLPQRHHVLWNDGPRMQAIHSRLNHEGLAPTELGKGCNVWYCLGYVQALGSVGAVALHDCDITTYDRSLLARLVYPVVHPQFGYKFCKGYYARVSDQKLNGRVSRLLVSPLIRTMKQLADGHPYLDYLDSFRYPLAGEFAMQTDVLHDLRIPSDWGLEIGLLSEMYRNYSTNRLCQVEVADTYDHKHQDLSAEDASRGLSRMSLDISKALFKKLATLGVVFNTGTIRTAKACYYRIALDLIESYANDASMNGLTLDRHAEEQAVELFAANILKAGEAYLDGGDEMPFIPSWHRVTGACPEVFAALRDAVSSDLNDMSGSRASSVA